MPKNDATITREKDDATVKRCVTHSVLSCGRFQLLKILVKFLNGIGSKLGWLNRESGITSFLNFRHVHSIDGSSFNISSFKIAPSICKWA